mmetsp:Transcript_61373/g.138285  ORF Transcript_61373/g.138285 Transcript_61373/m.138285 type:complete len:315 (-) Transcript_61373:245-1189(-)
MRHPPRILLATTPCLVSASCWNDVFQFEQCCQLRFERGNAHCWVGAHTYEACCGNWRAPVRTPPDSPKAEAEQRMGNKSVDFWRRLFEQGQMDAQASPDYRLRSELEQILLRYPEFLSACESRRAQVIDVLDVGSGPLSTVGKLWPTCPSLHIRTTQLDPHVGSYRKLLHSFGIPSPIMVEGKAESLPFKDASFTVVHARNSIDHTDDPVVALQEMLRVSQHVVFLEHYRNEGWHGAYWGWHHWNFDVDYERHLILWGRDGSRVDITRYLEGFAWVHVTILHQALKRDVGIPGISSRELVFAVIGKHKAGSEAV